jgi:S-adenosylmethionine:tRNA ribosyltransferase-isomerase
VLWDVWSPIAGRPVAFEPPSAGFALDWQTVAALRARKVDFVTITHAAGISSAGDDQIDGRLPFDEPFEISQQAADAIAEARRRGGRIVAIGTTVVRALEQAAGKNGTILAGRGLATLRIGPGTPMRVVDAIFTGVHERGTSHHELLLAFADEALLEDADRWLDRSSFRTHEFGDSVYLERTAAEAWKARAAAD